MISANQLESDFFSKISHDLRGSFTSILGFSDLLNDPSEKLSENEIAEFVKRIGIQTKDTFELLESFLLWLKLEKFNYEKEIEEINLLESIIEAENAFSKISFDEKIIIKNSINNNFYINTDLRLLHAALTNLFSFIFTAFQKLSSVKCSLQGNGVNKLIINVNYESTNLNLPSIEKLKDKKSIEEFGYSLFFSGSFFNRNNQDLIVSFIDDKTLEFTIILNNN